MPEDAPYDPYIPSGQAAPQQGAGGNARTQALQAVRYLFPDDGFGDGAGLDIADRRCRSSIACVRICVL